MRHNNSNRRSRKRSNGGNSGGHNNNRGGGNSRTKVYDSNGPDVRIRGTAHQVAEKYEALAKDAMASGNIVLVESYHQHAEHYRRIIGEITENAAAKNCNTNTNAVDGNRADNNAPPKSDHSDTSKNNKPSRPKAQSKPRANKPAQTKEAADTLPGMSDDLSLPASLLGDDKKLETKENLESA